MASEKCNNGSQRLSGSRISIKYEFDLIKLEYEQLAESYRHTYQTIWQAGSVFTAISAALLVFGSIENGVPGKIYFLTKLFWPLPFFFWWLGVFTPMDRYGKIRILWR